MDCVHLEVSHLFTWLKYHPHPHVWISLVRLWSVVRFNPGPALWMMWYLLDCDVFAGVKRHDIFFSVHIHDCLCVYLCWISDHVLPHQHIESDFYMSDHGKNGEYCERSMAAANGRQSYLLLLFVSFFSYLWILFQLNSEQNHSDFRYNCIINFLLSIPLRSEEAWFAH